MKIRNLMTIGLLVAGCATMAQAQDFYGQRRDVGRDLRVREDICRRIEADRRAVEHERAELRYSGPYRAGHEWRELQAARERLNYDERSLGSVNRDLYRDRRY